MTLFSFKKLFPWCFLGLAQPLWAESVGEKKTVLDFEGTSIQGELKKPDELSFESNTLQGKRSLVETPLHFHAALLREIELGP